MATAFWNIQSFVMDPAAAAAAADLDQLEAQITGALQEIDADFARAAVMARGMVASVREFAGHERRARAGVEARARGGGGLCAA